MRAAAGTSLVVVVCIATSAFGQTPAPIVRCESLLVSQQAAHANRKRPFFLRLTARSGATLTYLGVRHTYDPADTQFVAMRREFAASKPTVVFFEGSPAPVDTTAADAIHNNGEPGLARYLAQKAGIPARSLEPTRQQEVAELLKQFAAEDLVMFYTLRPLEEARDRRGILPPRLDTLFAGQLAYVSRMKGLEQALPDTAAFRAAFARKYPGGDPLALPADWFNPQLLSSDAPKRLFNAINYASSMFRDVYMYRQLALAMLEPTARVFAEVGRDHIPAQAAALQCSADYSGNPY
jgi:hypothetical protein